MKKLIALATVLALVVVLAVPVTAVNYAPDRPPWIYERQPDNTPSGDDDGWGEMTKTDPPQTSKFTILEIVSRFPGNVYLIVLWATNPVIDAENNVSSNSKDASCDRKAHTE